MSDPRDLLLDSTTPKFYIGGKEQLELARDVSSLSIEEDSLGMKRLSFSLGAIGPQRGSQTEQLLYLDGAILDFGVELKIAVGPSNNPRTVFSGLISALELVMQQGRDPEVRVFAEDKLMDLRMTRHFKTYENVSDSDLLQQIASQHGLTAQANVSGPTYKTVQQWNQSDLAFLRDRARLLHADIWIEDTTLHMASRDQRNGNQVTLIQGNDLLAVELRADLAHQRTSVKVGGFDEVGKQAIDEEASSSDVSSESSAGRGGVDVLNQAFGAHVSNRVREVPFADGEARAWARADLLRRARRFVTARGITLGSPTLAVGSLVTLQRVGKPFEGDSYYVTHVLHCFDTAHGLRTHFDAERSWVGRSS